MRAAIALICCCTKIVKGICSECHCLPLLLICLMHCRCWRVSQGGLVQNSGSEIISLVSHVQNACGEDNDDGS